MSSINEKLQQNTVGIAGLGGLGSTVAAALARTGVGRLIIADFDIVEPSNLNRQQYFTDQIGQKKTEATIENLRRINPAVKVDAYDIKLDAGNLEEIFAGVDIIAECFDKAEEKQMIIETVLSKMAVPVVSVSGLAGFGDSNTIQTRYLSKRLILVGDNTNGTDSNKLLTAGRVWIAASHQANAIVELLINRTQISIEGKR